MIILCNKFVCFLSCVFENLFTTRAGIIHLVKCYTKFSGKLTFLIPWHARLPLGVIFHSISVDLILILPTYPYQTGAQSLVVCLKYKFMLIKNSLLIYIILIHNLLITQSPTRHIFVDSLSIRHWNSTSKVSRYFIDYARH